MPLGAADRAQRGEAGGASAQALERPRRALSAGASQPSLLEISLSVAKALLATSIRSCPPIFHVFALLVSMPVEDNVTPSSWWVRTCLSVSAQTCKSARLRSLRICRASRWSPETREGIRADEVLGIPPPHTSKEWRSPTNENRSGFEGNYCSQVLPISENAPKYPSPPPFPRP